jgi:hypothetical protein
MIGNGHTSQHLLTGIELRTLVIFSTGVEVFGEA